MGRMNDTEYIIKGMQEAREFIRTRQGSGAKQLRLMDVCDYAAKTIKEQDEEIDRLKKQLDEAMLWR